MSEVTDSFPKGPIIRVNERELHILDSQYYATMYAGGTRKVNKDPPNIQGFGTPGAVIATVEHDVHRARRSYLNPYFSKRAVVGLEPVIHERIGRLCMRLEQAMHQGQPVDLVAAFAALTGDVVTQRFYGVHFDYLGIEDFKPAALEAFQGLSDIANLSRFLPGLVTFMKTLPIAVLRLIEPSVADLLTLGEEIKQNILTLSPNESKATTEAKSKSLIVEALKDPSIPAEERKIDRLMDEATIALFAGAETTARVLSVAMFHLVNNKSQTRKLVDELKTLPSKEDNAYSLSQLEALPFLVSFHADYRAG